MTNFNGINPSMLRVDTSRSAEYLYDKPKVSFFKKIAQGIGKAVSFLGPIGAAVTAVAVPGFGIPLAAGIYGASKIAGDVTANSMSKDAAKVASYNQEVANSPIGMPGLFEQASSSDQQTDFIVPTEMGPSISRTVVNREGMRGNMTSSF